MQINKNSQTTSTKCQYHAAASNPKWCDFVKWPKYPLNKQTDKKIVPTITWKPWKPVAIKNTDGYIPSVNPNGACIYSSAWKNVKEIPNKTVNNKLCLGDFITASFFLIKDISIFV